MQNELTDQALNAAPRCSYGAGEFALTENGVYYLGKDKDGNALPPQWLCSRLEITAKTRDEHGCEWGRQLEWRDDDGKFHQWAVPLEALEGDGIEVRKELARLGLRISHSRGARDLICAYIKAWPVNARARCVDRLGWHGEVYVCADRAFGESGERHLYQNAHVIQPAIQACGQLEDWQNQVSKLAQNNSRLIFAISSALAGPLAGLAEADSGGFHLRGQSSSGKSTALCVAASVWGKPSDYIRLWRSTTNGLEGLASLHNDGLLILDELSQIAPEAAGEAVYLLANGKGKARASKLGTARPPQQWRILFLSAGEESLVSLMAQGRKRVTAGQETRLADIPADAGASMGLFECLHTYATPNELAQALKQHAAEYYGSAGQVWLDYLARHKNEVSEGLRQRIHDFAQSITPRNAGGQVLRVANRFALVALAGEIATLAGITGWQEGEAKAAAQACFMAWLASFGGTGNHEEREIVEHTRDFLDTHGSSRFEFLSAPGEVTIHNRAGYWRYGSDQQREYLMTCEAFKREISKGYDLKLVRDTLAAHGILIRAKDGKPTQQTKINGTNRKVYVLRQAEQED